MIDFILVFIFIWVLVALTFGLFYMVWDVMADEMLFFQKHLHRKRAVIFLKITAIITLGIVFAIKIWG